MNDKRHGKGIIYYKNGNIKYDGDFVNGKFEGNSLSFFLIVGIFLGACVAFGSDGIIGTFKNDGKYKCQ